MRVLSLALCLPLTLGAGSAAAQFEGMSVKPILEMTRANWIAVREWDGQDLIYFTHIEVYRCGLSRIDYSVNDGKAQSYAAEPCHEGRTPPNAMTLEGHLPFVAQPLGSVDTVTVRLTFEDGSEASARFDRAGALID
ncbi:hypothetical protein [Anianabacter salinae]|uniref:hypothetical protein n=1 Tax=Anianabacter salinae TaxID=2851023 RepID=UPI00225E5312|nr:hypothetical protein [Anianabacter salinae]MBV0912873.1 hypothetical protein [Anianabacter salinae]